MYCPSCKDEFRSGFTHCASCNVDLVEDLSKVERPAEPAEQERAIRLAVRLAEYCGFIGLTDARQARDTLRQEGIVCEIAIRDAPGSYAPDPIREEYWLRVDASKYAGVRTLLGFDASSEADPDEVDDADTATCPKCGTIVAGEESFCAGCGERFSAKGSLFPGSGAG